MEIGATNISAMIGPHVAALATATNKFGIPYFALEAEAAEVRDVGRPHNVIYTFPDPSDVSDATIEIIRQYGWRDVAVIYDSSYGKYYL